MDFKKGDIIRGEQTRHPFVFINQINNETFSGCMLTHSGPERGYDNIELTEQHFEKRDVNGTNYTFKYDRTFFVRTRLLKEGQWGPFSKVGQLTEQGIRLIDDKLKGFDPVNWHFYKGMREENKN